MANYPTPHNGADASQIAKTVLMPGDPLRAKYIAEKYLEDVECFNTVRNMFGFTGTYKGKRVSVMGSGMGMPSIGIYSYELFNFYDVDNIVRIGSCGGMTDDIQLGDVVIGQGACTNSNFASQYELPGTFAPIGDYGLLSRAVAAAEKLGVGVRVGNILSSDTFYDERKDALEKWADMGVLGVEMEAAALYCNAAKAHKHALCMLSVSDLPFKGEGLSAEERQTSFHNMMEIALELAISE